jgi:integrase
MLRVPAESEKGNRDRLLPITPDFARLLLRVPPERRTGLVFALPREKAPGDTPGKHWVSHVVSQIGKAAGVIVDAGKGKHASAHDFRRSFGARWAVLVMPQVLMELMRHESIETTMRYYVGRQAEATADAAWAAWENRQ